MSYLGKVALKSSDIRRFDVTSSTSATHTLTWTPPNELSLIVTINGVKQHEDAYSVSGTTLTLTSALVAEDKLEVIGISDIGTTITPAQSSVVADHIVDGVITNAKINASAAIATSKVSGALTSVASHGLATSATTDTTNADNIGSGTLATARLGSTINLSGATVTFPAASVTAHVDTSPLRNDIATLALHSAIADNKAAYNLSNSFIDQFEDSTGVDVLTTSVRHDSEYMYSATQVTDSNCILMFPMDSTDTTLPLDSSTPDNWQLKSTDDGTYVTSGGVFSGLGYLDSGAVNTDGGFEIDRNSTTLSGLDFGTGGALTLEMWVKHDGVTTPGTHVYFYDVTNNAGNSRVTAAIMQGADDYVGDIVTNGGTALRSALTAAGFRHVTTVRDASGNTAVFFNGIRTHQATGNSTDIDLSDSDKLGISQRHNQTGSSNVYISQLRISDIARYDPTQTTLTVPTAALSHQTLGASATGNFTSATQASTASVSSMGIVVLYKNQSGTATLNTDLVAQVSANGGTNYSSATLVAGGTFSTGINIAAVSGVSVTAGTTPKYKISFANQSAGSKETQIHGVALLY